MVQQNDCVINWEKMGMGNSLCLPRQNKVESNNINSLLYLQWTVAFKLTGMIVAGQMPSQEDLCIVYLPGGMGGGGDLSLDGWAQVHVQKYEVFNRNCKTQLKITLNGSNYS
jgi:hypothetical protein